MKFLDVTVFPSEVKSIAVEDDPEYGGAHLYKVMNSTGFNKGETTYERAFQTIQFVQKDASGKITPGIQSEQLALILLDRANKLNTKYPSKQNAKMVKGLEMFLEACKERIEDRIARGVMGDLKK